MDFSFFSEVPEHTVSGTLQIEALAPLSMASGHPGNYYQSLRSPSPHMLYGMLENALGWHFAEDIRKDLFKQLQKDAKKANKSHAKQPWLSALPEASDSKYFSFLQYHLEFEPCIFEPATLTYDDLWSQHLRNDGANFMGGSKHYDHKLEPLINLSKSQDTSKPINKKTKKYPPYIEFGESPAIHNRLSLEEALAVERGGIHFKSVRSAYPQYYSSPKKREYVVPQSSYMFRFNTTQKVLEMLVKALENPAAPLYLGSNDGWIHATIEIA